MLPRRQGAKWITAPRAHQPGHDLRVECGTARSDPSQGVEEVIDVGGGGGGGGGVGAGGDEVGYGINPALAL